MRLLSSRGLSASRFVCPRCCRRREYSSSVIKESENVILKARNSTSEPIFLGNIQPGEISTHKGRTFRFQHNDIIGKEEREFVKSKGKVATTYRIFRPTLAEYTNNCPRIVTPIYSQDCALILSLLDLHPTHPGTKADKLEIFEAGTGNGSLTLHLARAIHAANTPPPPTVKSWEPEYEKWAEQYELWRAERRAIINTLDISPSHSKMAEMVVKGFRHGMYAPHVDFHIGQINEYLGQRLKDSTDAPFLEHVILDLPAAHNYIEIAAKALKTNGSLILFVPSITQIGTAVNLVKETKIPLCLEKTLEVGGAVGVGGREWDVRPVKPRALLKAQAESEVSEEYFAPIPELAEETEPILTSSTLEADNGDNGWEMVCRPKVGLRIAGGGFLGVWKKTKTFDT